MNSHHRHSIRLNGYDYSRAGAYFVTTCTQNRACLFGDIVHGDMQLNNAGEMIQTVWDELQMRFKDIELDEFIVMPNHTHGIIVLPHRRGESCIRPVIHPDEYSVIPPNTRPNDGGDDGNDDGANVEGDHKDRPYVGDNDRPCRPNGTLPNTVGRIVQAFKSITTHAYINGVKQSGLRPFPGKLWQRNYWEHIIRNEPELNRIRTYIRHNPAQWESDKLKNPGVGGVRESATEYAVEAWMI